MLLRIQLIALLLAWAALPAGASETQTPPPSTRTRTLAWMGEHLEWILLGGATLVGLSIWAATPGARAKAKAASVPSNDLGKPPGDPVVTGNP